MANSKAVGVTAMAAFLAIFLLMELAAALPYDSMLPESLLGRKVLEAKYEPTGRSGYNSHKPTGGRSGYNSAGYEPTGRSGYNGYKPTGRGGYN